MNKNETNETTKLTADALSQVKGGHLYPKLEIDLGFSRPVVGADKPSKWIDVSSVGFRR